MTAWEGTVYDLRHLFRYSLLFRVPEGGYRQIFRYAPDRANEVSTNPPNYGNDVRIPQLTRPWIGNSGRYGGMLAEPDLVPGINHGGPASFGIATVVLHTSRGKTISMTVSDRLGMSVNKVGITDYNSSVWKVIEGVMGVHGFPV